MLVYIIDGFNLAHKIEELRGSSCLQQDLIQYIKKHALTGSRNNKVTVVFDGNMRWGFSEKEFEVLFSGKHTADTLIKRRVENSSNVRQVVVVTDDREVRDFVRRRGASLCRVKDFIRGKKKKKRQETAKDISYPLARQITEELRRIWIDE